MKKMVFLLLLVITTINLTAQPGRIRVSFAGFDCYRETWDDILHMDGKGDEVFFTFGFTLADKNGNSKLSYEKRTGVYGDATGQFSNRTSVGSFTDAFGNNRGGIKAGDMYRCNDLIGEYDLADGDILTVIPTGWEHDPISDNSISFTSTMRGFYASINQKVAPLMIALHVLTGNLAGVVIQGASIGLSKVKAGGEQGELGKAGTRPIGMEKYGDFIPKLAAFNTPNLAAICNSDLGFGKGVIGVNYDEVAVGNSRDHGNYTILLKVEFFPNPNAPPAQGNTSGTNPAPSPAPGIKTVSGGFKKLNGPAAPVSVSIVGAWTGTYGNGESNTPNFYSFKLNADGTMQVIAANGNIIANGTYKLTNNDLNGSYNYTSGGTYSFAATMDANGTLNGTWGAGANLRGGGRWIMNKAGASATSNIR